MKKIISSIVVSSLLLSYANAESTTKNVYGTLKYFNAVLDSDNSDTSELSVGIGYITTNNNRIELNYNTMLIGSHDLKSFGLGYTDPADRSSFNINNIKITPEVGIAFRYYEEVEESSGLGFNIGVGFSAELAPEFEVGLGYEYKYIVWKDVDTGEYDTPTIGNNLHGFNFFTRYKF